jgi:TRAP-type C4-dicarboxylate transport system substrate-binding protein
MNKFKRLLIVFTLIAPAVYLHPLTVKLGSLAPKGSLWASTLSRIQEEWSKISDGKVELKIYSGGSVGDELDMIRKMRIGQLNAAALTIYGLNRIYYGTYSIQIPRLVRNMDEFKFILGELRPMLDAEYAAKGFKAMCWTHTGWVYLFSRKPVIVPDDLKVQKHFVNEKSNDLLKAWDAMGFTAVPLKEIDIVIQFQTGGIDSILTSPFYILPYYLYKITKNMLDFPWAPFVGAIVISEDTWNKIPRDLRVKLEAAAERITADMEGEWIAKEKEAIEVMKKNGLIVNSPTKSQVAEWDKLIETGYQQVLGENFDRKLYDRAKSLLDNYRKKKGK